MKESRHARKWPTSPSSSDGEQACVKYGHGACSLGLRARSKDSGPCCPSSAFIDFRRVGRQRSVCRRVAAPRVCSAAWLRRLTQQRRVARIECEIEDAGPSAHRVCVLHMCAVVCAAVRRVCLSLGRRARADILEDHAWTTDCMRGRPTSRMNRARARAPQTVVA